MRHSDRSVYLAAALFGAAAGAFFRGVFDPEVSRTPVNFVLSGVNGMIVAVSMIAAHLWISRHAADWLRRQSLAIELLADGGAMVAASVVAQIVAQLLFYRASPVQIASLMPSQMIFALVMAALFLAVAHIVRLIGARQFLSVLAGRYRRPVEELRIFLFVDLKGATHLAETLGPVRVAELIARFFHDVDDTIIEHSGEVHAYIGDEVIVTWPLETGTPNTACLRCVFAMRDCIAGRADSYAREFGLVPEFRAALHCGPVVVTEIGRSKEQIGYFGDTVNVAARLEEHAKNVDHGILISGELIDRIELPPGVVADDLGTVTLRGRVAPLRVVAVHRAVSANP